LRIEIAGTAVEIAEIDAAVAEAGHDTSQAVAAASSLLSRHAATTSKPVAPPTGRHRKVAPAPNVDRAIQQEGLGKVAELVQS
jgi:hypothetical protein